MKSILLKLAVTAFLAVLFASCASTETTTFTDPAFRGKQFGKICVLADIGDLKYKQKLENELAKNLASKGVSVMSGSQLFPPTREWSEEQMKEILSKEGIEGYLLIAWKDKHVQETYKPGQAVSETKGEVKKRNGKDVYTERTVTSQTDGSVEKQFHSEFEAKLIDVLSSNTAWIATSSSQSGEWFGSDFNLIMESYAEDIVDNMKKDRIIR